MIRLTVFLILFTACSSTGKYGRNKELALLHLQLGTSHLTQKNYPAALRELLEAEKLDPDHPIIQNNLGLAYFVRAEFNKALQHLLRAVELKPDYSEARGNLGRVYLETKEYSAAIKEFQIVANDLLYPQPEKALVNLGIAHFSRNDFARAEENFNKAIGLNKSYCPAYIFLGRTFLEQKNFAKAAKRLDYASQVCQQQYNSFDEPQYYSALAYLGLGQREKAVARLEQLIDVNPTSPFAEKSKQQLSQLKKD